MPRWPFSLTVVTLHPTAWPAAVRASAAGTSTCNPAGRKSHCRANAPSMRMLAMSSGLKRRAAAAGAKKTSRREDERKGISSVGAGKVELALAQSFLQGLFDGGRGDVADDGEFSHQQMPAALQHLLLAKTQHFVESPPHPPLKHLARGDFRT